MHVLWLTVNEALELKLLAFAGDGGDGGGGGGGEYAESVYTEFVRSVNGEVFAQWKNAHARALLLASWAVFLKALKPLLPSVNLAKCSDWCSEALDDRFGVIVKLERFFLMSRRFAKESRNHLIVCEALCDWLAGLLQHCGDEVRDLGDAEDQVSIITRAAVNNYHTRCCKSLSHSLL
jgi:hypothetical protein